MRYALTGRFGARKDREHFEMLERMTDLAPYDSLYLWTGTWLDDIQTRIKLMVGVPDTKPTDTRSRPYRITRAIRDLGAVGPVLDVCCGDALVLNEIKKAFPDMACYGVDLNAGNIPRQHQAKSRRVELYRVALQLLIIFDLPRRFDVVLMLNTFRSWGNAGMRRRHRFLHRQVQDWLEDNARRCILTVNDEQEWEFERCGYRVRDLGPGEQKSRLVMVSW